MRLTGTAEKCRFKRSFFTTKGHRLSLSLVSPLFFNAVFLPFPCLFMAKHYAIFSGLAHA